VLCEGKPRLIDIVGYAPLWVSHSGPSTRLWEDASRRHDIPRLFVDEPSFAPARGVGTWPMLTIGRDVAIDDLRSLLDASTADQLSTLARIKVDAARRRFVTT